MAISHPDTTNFLSSALSTTLSHSTIASATTNASAIPAISAQASSTSLNTLTPSTPALLTPLATSQASSCIDISRLSSQQQFQRPTTATPSTVNIPTYNSFSANVIRKKSGERVKSSLKLPSLVRPKSMPSTASKMVHFDANLEHVRHFLHSERPTAVSVTASPADERAEFHWATDSDSSSEDSEDEEDPRSGFQQYLDRSEWKVTLPNFPHLLIDQMMTKNVFVESLFLSSDKQSLVGHIAVRNLDFYKTVCIRYTVDYWKTFTEVQADYNDDVRKKRRLNGFDRFTFAIALSDLAYLTLSSKSMYLCVRYVTAGQEFWDNNDNRNYEIVFSRVAKSKENIRAKNSSNNSMARVGRRHRKTQSSSSIIISGPEHGIFGPIATDKRRVNDLRRSSASELEAPFANFQQQWKQFEGGQRNLKLDSEFNKDFDHFASLGTDDIFDDLTTPRLKKSDSKDQSQFRTRYSFGASFNATPTKGHSENVIKRRVSPHEVEYKQDATFTFGANHQTNRDGNKRVSAKTRQDPTDKLALNAMSYQDLLKNYCFFQGSPASVPTRKIENNEVN